MGDWVVLECELVVNEVLCDYVFQCPNLLQKYINYLKQELETH